MNECSYSLDFPRTTNKHWKKNRTKSVRMGNYILFFVNLSFLFCLNFFPNIAKNRNLCNSKEKEAKTEMIYRWINRNYLSVSLKKSESSNGWLLNAIIPIRIDEILLTLEFVLLFLFEDFTGIASIYHRATTNTYIPAVDEIFGLCLDWYAVCVCLFLFCWKGLLLLACSDIVLANKRNSFYKIRFKTRAITDQPMFTYPHLQQQD